MKNKLIQYAIKYGTPEEVEHIKKMTNNANIRTRYNWYLVNFN